ATKAIRIAKEPQYLHRLSRFINRFLFFSLYEKPKLLKRHIILNAIMYYIGLHLVMISFVHVDFADGHSRMRAVIVGNIFAANARTQMGLELLTLSVSMIFFETAIVQS